MLKLRPLLLLALFAASLLSAPEARADTVTLTGGLMNVSFGDIRFNSVTGTDGFSLHSSFSDDGFRFNMCNSITFDPCAAGQVVNGGGSIAIGIGPPQNVTLGGVEYPGVALQGSSLNFVTGPFMLQNLAPTAPGQVVTYTVTVPFTMTGTIIASGFDGLGGSTGETFFTLDVVGSGMVSIFVGQTGSAVFFSGASFAFQPVQPEPVPEPATLLLLSGGLAGLAARARRRKARG